MRIFTNQKTITNVSRITSYTSGLSNTTTVTGITSCYLRPLSDIESSTNGFQYGTAFNALFEIGTDIRELDKITIDSVQYTVQGVAVHDRGINTQYVKALIVKPMI